MSVHSDVIYHHFPISSQYLKTWGVDSPVTYTGSRELQVLFIRYVLRKHIIIITIIIIIIITLSLPSLAPEK